ncbi:DNA topoisomerase 3 [Gracilariopsis chorda]|uniref:DNA topoisomerase n=1 Tax=Gracilariopsis chorda TaxID=448386 RepID=A0A2V3IPA9_9FLOR|nr:DNA topoisomerase 3 [Gracilariopsis chorda]|eukprot:PXF43912.1 DNA topoisomerase 3 [Gracilariopsis chorda]
MVLRILNVAEKPSAAKEITGVLKGNQAATSRQGQSRYNPIYEFNMSVQGHSSLMVFTSVTGHIKSTDFEARYRKWGSCDPSELLIPTQTAVEWFITEDKQPLARTLRAEARRADWLVLWLDCDSEGERIAWDVADICKEVKPTIVVKRARFSAMTRGDLLRAINQLTIPDERVAQMVATRQELDLRAGSAYTRYLTKQLEKYSLTDTENQIISYGPCQFPTLGLVVDRWLTIQNFVSRPFWVFELKLRDCEVPLEWFRKQLFDEYTAMALYELCAEEAEADGNVVTVKRADKRIKTRWRPLPLSTVELQKVSSRSLRINSHRTMEIAESLYNKGLISYPRTETNRFSRTYDLKDFIQKQTGHPTWGQFAERLLSPPNHNDPVTFNWPRTGPHDDGAHPPIHPTHEAPPVFDSPDHQRVYEYIAKRFLASCSIDAVGSETRSDVLVGSAEIFTARGLIVEQKGYLEVLHPYEKWNDKEMPISLLDVNSQLPFESFTFRRSQTIPPPLLQEADLIALMDHHGIGTDATIAEHIRKVLDREYVEKVMQGRFSPTEIGKALVIAHEQCEIHLARPHMRAKQENELKRILSGEVQPSEVLCSALDEYRTKLDYLKNRRNVLHSVFSQHFAQVTPTPAVEIAANFSRCACGAIMSLIGRPHPDGRTPRGGNQSRGRGQSRRRGRGRNHASGRSGWNERLVFCRRCNKTHRVPRNGGLEPMNRNCPLCQYQVLEVTLSTTARKHTVCPLCLNEPPNDISVNPESKESEFRCFHCTHSDCALAKGTPASLSNVSRCPTCGSSCVVRVGRDSGTRFIKCSNQQRCNFVYWFPNRMVDDIQADGQICPICQSKQLRVVWKPRAVPPSVGPFQGCIWCDQRWIQLLRSVGEDRCVPRPPHPGNRRGHAPTRVQIRGRGGFRQSRGRP